MNVDTPEREARRQNRARIRELEEREQARRQSEQDAIVFRASSESRKQGVWTFELVGHIAHYHAVFSNGIQQAVHENIEWRTFTEAIEYCSGWCEQRNTA